MKAKKLRQFLDKFLVSPVQKYRFRLRYLTEKKLDVSEIQLLESRVIGDRDTHILNFKGVKLQGTWKMPKIIASYNSLHITFMKPEVKLYRDLEKYTVNILQ